MAMCGILLGSLGHLQGPARLVQLCTNRALLLAPAIMVMRSHLRLSFVTFLALIRPAWPGVQMPGPGFRYIQAEDLCWSTEDTL